MRILELDLRAFGPFTNAKLDLTAGREGMHILYGSNEAGKSSALRALKCLLYGIPKQSADNFIHENKALRIGGRVRNSDGAELAFLRRKGYKDTLLNPDGEPIDERVLLPYLHGVTEELFEVLFGIDHDALVRGGRNILAGQGETGQSLFAAGVGGANLREVLDTIEAEVDALFKPKGQLPALNKAIGQYQELKKKIAALSFSGREWAEKEKELDAATADRAEIQKALDQCTAETSRLKRLREIVPKAGVRRELLARLEALGDVVVLPEDFTKRRHRTENRLNAAREVKRKAELDLERLREEKGKIELPVKILDHAEAIENIHQRLGQHRKAAEDLGKLQGRLQQNMADIEALLFEFKPELELEKARGMRPKATIKSRIQRLANRHEGLLSVLAQATKETGDAEERLKKLEAERTALEVPKDPGPLKKSLAGLGKRGDLAVALRDATKALRDEEKVIRSELKRLPLWSHPFEELGRVPVPSSETVNRFDGEFADLKERADGLERHLEEKRGELEQIEERITAIRMTGAVPTEGDLERERGRRELGWSLVRRAWLQGENVEEESRAYNPEQNLAEAYEDAVEQADEIADRLRREAARVAEYASLLSRAEKVKKEIEKREADRGILEQADLAQLEEWKQAWRPAGIEPLTAREMRGWLEQYARILQRLEKLGEHKAQVERLEGLIAEHGAELGRCLGDLSEKIVGDKTFGAIVEKCEAVLERMEKLARRHGELATKIAAVKEALEESLRTKAETEGQLVAWRADWQEAVKALGLDEGTPPEEALLLVAKLDELFKKIDDCEGLEKRIFGINRDSAAFRAEVEALVERAAPDLAGLAPEHGALQLNAERTRAIEAATRFAQLEKEIERKSADLEEAAQEIVLAGERLDELCQQAGCARHDELERRERRSAEYKELKKEIETLEKQIVELGGGAALAEILAEVENVDVDSLPARIEASEAHLADLRERQRESGERVGGLRSDLGRIDGSPAASQAAEEAQEVLATIRNGVEDYVRVRLASVVLRQAIENYRAKNQGPLLARASDLFAQLTLGSFAGLKTDYNENDEPVLQGVRPSSKVVDVAGMSDGTLDQLYLSLRLATLERYLEKSEPMPFIVDDILIRFDDDRAKAALEVLADLSRKTQVLFFTHHLRMTELAQEIKTESGIFLTWLD